MNNRSRDLGTLGAGVLGVQGSFGILKRFLLIIIHIDA